MSNQHKPVVVIIGGGAAGFMTAITVAEDRPDAHVLILERGTEVLQKVKISGGGRCNVTHACFIPKELVRFYPRGNKALLGPFNRFGPGDTIAWFEARGVNLKIEDDNRMFPDTDDSQTIMDCLWRSAQQAGVQVRTGCRVTALMPPTETQGWQVVTASETIQADAVMVAAGSSTAVWTLLKELGHNIIPTVPSLFTFNIKDPRIEGLAGLSVSSADVRVKDTPLEAQGPLLVTHWGLSGPGILRVSAWGARVLADKQYAFTLLVSWAAGYSVAEVQEYLMEMRLEHSKKQIEGHAQFGIPSRLWKRLVAAAKSPVELRWADLSKAQALALAKEIAECAFEVRGKSTFKDEFVTAGGVDLDEVNFKTFESKLLPGLFFAGEILDIDAVTGGFNFQAAWTGGWIAGKAIGEKLG